MNVFGNISPINSITIAIGKNIKAGSIDSLLIKYIVANEVAKILDIFVPINIIIKNSSLLVNIFSAQFRKRNFFCLFQTFICKGFADKRAISELEKSIENNNPMIDRVKYKSNIIV